jgi:hypothetical protein
MSQIGPRMTHDLDELREMLAKAPARSPWAAYLRRNFSAFREAIGSGPIDWQAVSTWAFKKGHTGGKPLTAAAAKKAFYRELVHRHGPQRKQPVAAPQPVPQPVQPVRPWPVRMADEPAPQPKVDPLDSVRKAAAASRPWETPVQPKRDPDPDPFAALNAGREWLPKKPPGPP